MKQDKKTVWFPLCFLLLLGTVLPGTLRAQTQVTINGPATVCVGDMDHYTTTPGLDPAYSYTWTVTPGTGSGQLLSDTVGGATIQWTQTGTATITLTGIDPANNNSVEVEGSLNVTIHVLPTPHITSNNQSACQPLQYPNEPGVSPPFEEEDCWQVCESTTVTYTAHGTIGSSYQWNITGALSVSSSGNTCQVTWGGVGSGTVSVTETTTNGCSASDWVCISIIKRPEVDFMTMPTINTNDNTVTICRYGSVIFIDQSSAAGGSPIVSWHWDFGDGSYANVSPGAEGNPISHQYDDPGNYEVELVITNACGCTAKMGIQVVVQESPAPVITCPRVACLFEEISYKASPACDNGTWSVDGGNIQSYSATEVSVIWDDIDPNTGFGYISYLGCEPCPYVVTEAIPVVIPDANILGEINICAEEQYVYRLPKWPTTEFDWNIQSGSGFLAATDQPNEIALTAGTSGTIILECSYFNTVLGCTGYSSITLTILPKPAITGEVIRCLNTTGSYQVGGHTGNWVLHDPTGSQSTFSGTTYTPTFNMSGTWRLDVTGSTFCPPQQFLIKVHPKPAMADYIHGPDVACEGIPVPYTAGDMLPGTSFVWGVSSGTANAAFGPESYISFAGSASYMVKVVRVTVDEARCPSDTLYKVIGSPVPALEIAGDDTVCHSEYVPYAVNYEEGDYYAWSITPAELGSIASGGQGHAPQVLWNIPQGAGQVATLRVDILKCGTTHTQTLEVYVRNTPTIAVSLATGQSSTICSGDEVNLVVTVTSGTLNSGGVFWNWGNGTSSVYAGFTTNWTSPPYYTTGATGSVVVQPSIAVSTPNGCLGHVSATGSQITVLPAPVAHISPATISHCGPFSGETLTATITTGIGGINTFHWTVPGGQTPPGNVAVFNGIDHYGAYTLEVENSNGCYSALSTANIFEHCPAAGCGPSSIVVTPVVQQDCNEISISVTVTGATTGYEWLYPPEAQLVGTPTATQFDAIFEIAGVYQVAYKANFIDGNGTPCYHLEHIDVEILFVPDMVYAVSCNSGSGSYEVTLHDNTNLLPGVTPTRSYYVGSTPLTPDAFGLSATTSLSPGNHDLVQVVSYGAISCTSQVNINLPAWPQAIFTLPGSIPNPGCKEDVVFDFQNTSITPPLSYFWNFDPGQNINPNGAVTYMNSGTYNVSLVVTNEHGCSDTAYLEVVVADKLYDATVTATPNPACQGNAVTLTYLPQGVPPEFPDYYTWYREQDPLFTTTTPTYNVFTPGGYWALATDDYGCREPSVGIASVDIIQVPLAMISGSHDQCFNTDFMLHTLDIPGASYEWKRDGSTVANGAFPSITQNLNLPPGTYTYTVTLTYNGCTRTSPDFDITLHLPPAPPTTGFDVLNCYPYLLKLEATGGSGGAYNWSNGMTGQTITTWQGGPYKVVYTAPSGCSSEGLVYTPKDPQEYLWIFPTGCFCKPEPREPYLVGPIIPFDFWAWNLNGSPDQAGSGLVPDYYLPGMGTYSLSLNNGYCNASVGVMHFDTDYGCNYIRLDPPQRQAPLTLTETVEDPAMLLLPNPAGVQVTVQYRFATEGAGYELQLCDLTGRILERHHPADQAGSLDIRLDGYAAGMYLVLMRENGRLVQQERLTRMD